MDGDAEMDLVEPDDGEDMEKDESDDEGENGDDDRKSKNVYLPGQPLKEGEELICDDSAYIMLHQASTGAPCLSFDIIPDHLGEKREQYPLTAYMIAGTQASSTQINNLIVMKMYNLHKTKENGEDEEDEDELEDDEDDTTGKYQYKEPQMLCALIKHHGCVNRVRCKRMADKVCAASWSELGRVNIWDLSRPLQAIEDSKLLKTYEKEVAAEPVKPIFSFNGHQQEGFAIDWSPCAEGVLATGDCKKDIHIWSPLEDGKWKIDQRPLVGHSASVEDIQWSPNEPSVLASCSVDKTIRIWDCRASPQKACMLTAEGAHESDINVISWNRMEPFIVSGGDDGYLHIWDLRQFESKKPVASFKHHAGPITTVEWNPHDPTVFGSGGSDDQIALWDLAVEKDEDQDSSQIILSNKDEVDKLPPQLLFIHQGQNEIKEIHWHPQLPGVILSTAHSGFNIFRTISV